MHRPSLWLRSARVAQVPDLALKKVQCMWRQDWHKCRTRKGCVTLGTGNVYYLALKFTLCTVQCFLKRWSKEFWLASSFEGHGSSLRSLPHPSNYPRTPLIWFEQQVLFFNLRLAMIWHVFLVNFLQWLQNTQEAPCLCHSGPGWYETIGPKIWVSVAVMKILGSVRQNQ